jgi:hypothetical protein
MKAWLIPVGVVAVVLAGACCLSTSAQPADPPKTVQWENRVLDGYRLGQLGGAKELDSGGYEDIEKGLNKLGAEGWELVAVRSRGPAISENDYYLKRPKK